MKPNCACGGLKKYAEGGKVRPRVPTRNTRFIDPESESMRGRGALAALKGYAGAERPSVMVPGAGEAYDTGELAGLAEALIPGAAMGKGLLGAALAGVIKPRGGNWLDFSVDNSLLKLLRNDRGGVEDLQQYLQTARNEFPQLVPEYERYLEEAVKAEPLNKWIQGPLTKYIKRDLATPDDPVRKLAEQGILHFNPEAMPRYMDDVYSKREAAGFPLAHGTSPLAQRWEAYADEAVLPYSVGDYSPTQRVVHPWMEKLDPSSKVYEIYGRGATEDLGFNHLVDELSNALDPASGLPRNLQLRPEQMQQMGMEKAVRHVDAINKWRAENRIKENAELANKAAILREYPDSPEMPNPKGLRWMELKASDPDEGLIQVGRDGGAKVETPDGPKYFDSPEAAKRFLSETELGRQLKYEGDTMGHCVGGYCPDVMEGRSRIFSLRDAKGEPHVTVEVAPEVKSQTGDAFYRYDATPEQKRRLEEMTVARAKEMGIKVSAQNSDFWELLEDTIVNSDDFKKYLEAPAPQRIVQIKGKGNAKPKDDYLPFVQDFVRNAPEGSWAGVGDLKNTGLVNMKKLYGDEYPPDLPVFMTREEQQMFNTNYPNVRSIMDQELDEGNIDWEPEGFAGGGLVADNGTLARIIEAYNGL